MDWHWRVHYSTYKCLFHVQYFRRSVTCRSLNLPFHHFSVSEFCHFVISSFCHSVVSLFHRFVILSFDRFVILSFCHFIVSLFSCFLALLFSHFVVVFVLSFCPFVVSSFCHLVILSFCTFCHFVISSKDHSKNLLCYIFAKVVPRMIITHPLDETTKRPKDRTWASHNKSDTSFLFS